MKLGFFQYAVIARDPEANFARIAGALRGCRCDLLVLPELFTCGYAFSGRSELLPFAERLVGGRTVAFLREQAVAIGGVVTGTFPELGDDGLYNTAVMVDSGGLIGYQRKVHLPEYEKQFFRPGEAIGVVELPGGMKVGMMSCFDCWFPQFGALLRQQGARIFCNSASFGGSATPTILPVRARENQVFVISCNRIGSENFAGRPEKFYGHSRIVSPDGVELAGTGEEERLAVVEVDPDEVVHPAFGSLICRDFSVEHRKYAVKFRGRSDSGRAGSGDENG